MCSMSSCLACLTLDRFYKSQGFVPEDRFQVEKEDGSVWPGFLLRMDIDQSLSQE